MRRYPGPPDAPVCGPHQSDDNHNIDVSARPRVGLLPLCCKATGYLFQGYLSPPHSSACQRRQRRERSVVVQFSGAVFVGSGRASTTCFICRRLTPLHGVPSPRPWKRAGMKVYCRACSTGTKASLMPGVTCCTNAHHC